MRLCFLKILPSFVQVTPSLRTLYKGAWAWVQLEGRICSVWEHGSYLYTCGQRTYFSFFLVELKLMFSSGKHLYLLKVGFMGTFIERTLVQEHSWNIYLLDIDWKRNLIYWNNAQGHLFRSTVFSREKQEIWKEPPGKLGYFGKRVSSLY